MVGFNVFGRHTRRDSHECDTKRCVLDQRQEIDGMRRRDAPRLHQVPDQLASCVRGGPMLVRLKRLLPYKVAEHI